MRSDNSYKGPSELLGDDDDDDNDDDASSPMSNEEDIDAIESMDDESSESHTSS